MSAQSIFKLLNVDRELVPKSVLVMPLAVTNWVYERLLPKMHDMYGTKFTILAPQSRHDYILATWCGPNDKVISTEEIEKKCFLDYPKLDENQIKLAQKNEKRLNINYMQDIVQLDRRWSAPFLSRAPWSPYDKLKSPTVESMTGAINEYISFSEKILKTRGVDLVLVWPLEALSASLVAVAQNRDIPVSYPYVSSRKSLLYWASSAYSDDSQHRLAYDSMDETKPIPITDVVPPASVTKEISQMDKDHSFIFICNLLARKIFYRLEFFYLDLRKFDFSSKKRLSLFDDLSQNVYRYVFYKRLTMISERNIDAFDKKPFIYFSLALEPEFSVQARSKEFNDQATIIKQLALSLPTGYELVVKEHVLLGRRSISYYAELLKFPNVRMAHPSIKGVDLAKKAAAVATMAGSVTLEATLLGKPVFEFSTHSVFSFLPNVTTVRSFHGLPSVILNVLESVNAEWLSNTRRSGAKMLKAVEAISFDGAGSPIFGKNEIEIDNDGVVRMVELLISLFQAKKAGLCKKFSTFQS